MLESSVLIRVDYKYSRLTTTAMKLSRSDEKKKKSSAQASTSDGISKPNENKKKSTSRIHIPSIQAIPRSKENKTNSPTTRPQTNTNNMLKTNGDNTVKPPQPNKTERNTNLIKNTPANKRDSLLELDRDQQAELPYLIAETGTDMSIARILQASRYLEHTWIQTTVKGEEYEECSKAAGKEMSEEERKQRESESLERLRRLNDSLEDKIRLGENSDVKQALMR